MKARWAASSTSATPPAPKQVTAKHGDDLGGNLKDLRNADDKRYILRSAPAGGDRYKMECDIKYKSRVQDARGMDIAIEGKVSTADDDVLCKVFAKNWNSGRWDRVGTFQFTKKERRRVVYGLRPNRYLSDRGKVVIRIRQTTENTADPGWKSHFDVVQVRVR